MIMYYITVLIFIYVLATMYTSLYSYRKRITQLEDKLKTKVIVNLYSRGVGMTML